MENKKELQFVMINLQKKYNKLNEFMNLTKEMEKSLNRNDQISFEMLLAMRQEIIIDIDNIDNVISLKLNETSGDIRKLLIGAMKLEEETFEPQNEEEKLITQIYWRIRRLLEKIITVDKAMNRKIGGKDSYYSSDFER